MFRLRWCLGLALFVEGVLAIQERTFRAVVVEENLITSGYAQRIVETSMVMVCAFYCHREVQCRSFCFNGSLCSITDYLLSRNYVRANTLAPTTKCYTSRNTNLALHAPLRVSTGSHFGPASGLVDGLFTQQEGECYRSSLKDDNFLALDLGKPTPVHEIILHAWIRFPIQTSEINIFLENQDPIANGVLVNNTEAIVDTRDLTLLNNEYTIQLSPPQTARWIVLYKSLDLLALCSIEVY